MTQAVVAVFKADATAFNGTLRGMSEGMARWEKGSMAAMGRVEKGLDSLLSSAARIRNVSYLIAGGLGASQFTQFIDTSVRIRNELRGIGQDTDENFQKIYLAATRSMAPFDAFMEAVMRMQKSMGDKQSFDVTIRQMETLNKLLAVGGKSASERASTIMQFAQAMQAGALQDDEMRSLRENAPVELLRAIAREAGGTLKDLKKFSQEGVITADIMSRALDGLAATADTRIKQVTLTIGDAVNVLRNGAIVASEAFNDGAMFSRATVAGMSALGSALANSADAMWLFGKAAQIAAVLFGSAFAGRKLSEATAGLAAFYNEMRTGESVRQNLLALRNDVFLAQTAVAKATETLTAKKAALAAAEAKGTASAASLAKAQASVAAAERNLFAQRLALTEATNAATVAQGRLTVAARASAAAVNMSKSAWAFIGGWPGAILIVATALYTLRSNAQAAFGEAVDRIKENDQAISDLRTSYDEAVGQITADLRSLEQAHRDVADAARSGDAETQRAAMGEVAAINERIAKNRELLATYSAIMAAKLQSSMDDLASLKSSEARSVPRVGAKNRGDVARSATEAETKAYVDSIQKRIIAGEELSDAETKFLQRHLEIVQAQQEVDAQTAALNRTLASTQEGLNALVERSAASTEQEISKLAVSLAAIGESDVAGQMMSLASAMESYQADFEAGRITSAEYLDLMESLRRQTELYIQSLSDVDAVRFDGLMAQFSTMLGWLNSLTSQAWTLSHLGQSDMESDARGRRVNPPPPASTTPPSSARGGGQSQAEKDQKAALDFIKEMMTAEEQRAAKLGEVLELRQRIVDTYGEESSQVAELDAAIQRYKESTNEAAQAQAQFFDDLATQLANSITDWTNFGDVVRNILASMVQSYGPDFFTALLTPGLQSGSNPGTLFGNMLTGQNHSGGGFANQNARSVPAAAFIGAPRFHNGLMPDEFTSILQRGETVLPKGFKGFGGGVSINMPVDMRGADPSMKPYIEAQVAQLRKEIPQRVVSAVKSAQKSRSL